MAKTVPIQMESVALLHVIPDQDKLSYFDLLDNLKVGFKLTATYLVVFLVTLALSHLLNELTYRIRFGCGRSTRIQERILGAFKSLGVPRLTAVGLFVLFFQLFLWFSQLFLTNNIKTNKVVRAFFWRLKINSNLKKQISFIII